MSKKSLLAAIFSVASGGVFQRAGGGLQRCNLRLKLIRTAAWSCRKGRVERIFAQRMAQKSEKSDVWLAKMHKWRQIELRHETNLLPGGRI